MHDAVNSVSIHDALVLVPVLDSVDMRPHEQPQLLLACLMMIQNNISIHTTSKNMHQLECVMRILEMLWLSGGLWLRIRVRVRGSISCLNVATLM